jgi:hypothetical protein
MDEPDKIPPLQVGVTAKFLADSAAKQKAYELQRRMWTSAYRPSEPRAQALAVSRRRGQIHDPRQRKLDL